MPYTKKLWISPVACILLFCMLFILILTAGTAKGGDSPVSADIEGGPYTYTGAPLTPAVTLTANGIAVAASYYSLIYEDNVEPGTGKISITYTNVPVTGSGGEETLESGIVTKTFAILKAPVTVDFSGTSNELIYNGTVQSISFHLPGEVASGAAGAYITYSGTDTQPKITGSYTATVSISDDAHYQLLGENTYHFTILPAQVTVIFPAAVPSYIYNGLVQGLPYQVSDPVLGEDPIVQVTYTKGGAQVQPRNAGSYTATAVLTGDDVNANYQLAASAYSFTIGAKYLSIRAQNSGKLLGTKDPTPIAAYEMDGQAAGETPILTGRLERRAGEAAGEYPILIGSLALDPAYPVNDNYILGYEAGGIFNISELTDAPDASLSPAKPDGKDGWYISRVRIVAPEGYQIGRSPLGDVASWYAALENDDGKDILASYCLRRISDGAITKAKQAPRYSQDTALPDIASVHAVSTLGGRPLLVFAANDDVLLDRIDVLMDGQSVYTMRPKDHHTNRFSFGYPLINPGIYNAVAYDAAGNRALETIEITVTDTDKDGLTDLWEENIGTDIHKTDSDSDGIDDRASVYLSIALPDDSPLPMSLMAAIPGSGSVPESILESQLFETLEDVQAGDEDSAPPLDSTAAIVQYDRMNGSGWALSGSRLVRFLQENGVYKPKESFSLNGSFGATRLVTLSSGDGSIFLLANWNEDQGEVSGNIQLLDTRINKLATLAGTDGATAFDLSTDGTRAAYRTDGMVHVVDLANGSKDTVRANAAALTFTPSGLAIGGRDDSVQFYRNGSVKDAAYLGLVDMAQRTNTTRTVTAFTKAGQAPVSITGKLTFSSDASAIVFDGGEHVVVVGSAGE